MGQDGPVLQSILLVSENYICEVRLTEPLNEFDFCAKTVRNMRFRYAHFDVKSADGVVQTHQMVTISLRHGELLETRVSFVGDDCNKWVTKIKEAMPIELLRVSS
jgi:hypothetical protein